MSPKPGEARPAVRDDAGQTTQLVDPPHSVDSSAAPEPPVREFRPVEKWIDVPGFQRARLVVSDPIDDAVFVMGLHGAGGNAEWFCSFWRDTLPAPKVLACPAGKPMGEGARGAHYFPEHYWLEKEVMAVRAAAISELGQVPRPDRTVYLAYSQGATMGALMLPEHGDVFPRLLLVEGGFSEWNVAIARRFAASGGREVHLFCGTGGCRRRALRSVEWLRDGGVVASYGEGAGAGHTYGGRVADVVVTVYQERFAGDAPTSE